MPEAGPGCQAPRLTVPGPDRFTGVLGSWSRRNWLPEGCGRHSYPPGKTRRGHVSCHCRVIATDGVPVGMAGGG